MPFFIFLHVATMFLAVAAGYGPMLAAYAAIRRRDVLALRGIVRTGKAMSRWVGPLFIVGLLFGIVAIFTNGFDPLAGWLLIAYGLFALAAVSPMVTTGPWLERLAGAADASPDDAFSPDLVALVSSRRSWLLLALDASLVVLLIADMVLKPLPGRIF